MLFSVCSLAGSTVKTADSVTSTYNLPTTILRCTPGTRFLILEMGVEYKGDMDFYTWLAHPDIGIFLNLSPVHSSFLGSLSDIAAEKAKLLFRSQVGIAYGDDPNISLDTPAPVYKFGSKANFLVRILKSRITSNLTTQVDLLVNHDPLNLTLPFLGPQFGQNAAAVAAAAFLLKIPPETVKKGLETTPHPAHRLQPIRLKNGSIIIDDTYNANPLSVSESLKTLSLVSGAYSLVPVFVFGQMNELGQYEKEEHEKIGLVIKNLALEIRNFKLYCLGPATKFTIATAGFGQYFDDIDSLTSVIQKLEIKNLKLVILIKGSHSWQMENLVTRIVSWPQ
jgi:UDP-N-acetylmuramoyl-tripeptide--D-alanyl-D-alanine ligase